LEKGPQRGIRRLTQELDFLKQNGVTNVRLMAGAEGSGLINGVMRVGPSLQPEQSRFDAHVLDGLDRVLFELGKRRMTAVIFLSNNWEWSGGFQQYLLWNGIEPSRFIGEKPTWDEYRDLVSQFYSCEPCKLAYLKQVDLVLGRVNKLTGKRYTDDPAIMAWELANEPRPMRPEANDAYKKWIADAAAHIKSKDKYHLVTAGTEGWIGLQDIKLYEEINADRNIDYLTIHIWPKNWAWFTGDKLADGFQNILTQTDKYIAENAAVARSLDKPLVIEEFGLPRDGIKFDAASPTTLRNKYYARVLSFIAGQPSGNEYIAGANFWAFGGAVRPIAGQTFWKPGDQYLGDPPMEEQGLNTVYDTDRSTWNVIRKTSSAIKRH
jgi:mannan endo-1,4-beta-mannosidase